MSIRSLSFFGSVGVVATCAVSTALGQYATGFETADGINASTGGTVLTGQDAYYIPDGTVSVDYLAYTYSGNALGINANPNGGAQFVAVEGPGVGAYGRAQRDMYWGTGTATMSYDVCCVYTGQPPASDNLGSFSLQPYPGGATAINLFSWMDINTATEWRATYLAYDVNGVAHVAPGMTPGVEWDNLELNHWYHFESDVDFGLNRFTEVRITDLETNVTTTFNPTDWYLEGGANGPPGVATGFRMFSGGGTIGNVCAFDNMDITIEDAVDFDLTLDMPNGCPGPITVSWTNSPGQGQQALVVGNNSAPFVIPVNLPCGGTTIGVSGQVMVVDPPGYHSNGGGSGQFSGNVNAQGACGKYLQLVKAGVCEASDVERIGG
jgi:hypothetical protein